MQNEKIRKQIEEMVHREIRAWDAQDADTLVDLFHPDMVWPWPPTPHHCAHAVARVDSLATEPWNEGL